MINPYLNYSAVITCYYSTSAVLQAFGTTAGIVLTVTGLTFWSKFDITKVSFGCYRYKYKSFVQFWMIFFIIPPLMLFSWLFAFISGSSVAITCYCAIGVVAFTIYLAFGTFTLYKLYYLYDIIISSCRINWKLPTFGLQLH